MLSDMGISAFAEQARHEVAATGETARRRRVDTVTALTAQEAHIARLAAEGRINPEIAAQLYVSPRTVEWHMSKIFTKLGVSSRRRLEQALRSSPDRRVDDRDGGSRRSTPPNGRGRCQMAPHERNRAGGAEPPSVDPGSGLPGIGAGWPTRWGGSDSTTTVLVALAANLLVAVAKSAAAVVTGSASLTAEAAHSWADTGNELFLVVANRRATRPPDQSHPLGHGREAYVWSLFAALGLFAAGGAVSIAHGINELRAPTPADDFLVGYIVLAISFVLEGTSLLRSVRQADSEARVLHRDLIEHVAATSDPTLRAVFAEDVAALIGLVLAAAGLGARQLSGSAVPDAVGSILVGLLLAVVAVQLINRNRRFLVGEEADPRLRVAVLQALLDMPEVARVTFLRLEVVGPRMIAVTGAVDLTGDDVESHLGVRLRALERRISNSPAVAGAVLSLSAPDEPSLLP
jgi:cation diffusion facilitator family transporter